MNPIHHSKSISLVALYATLITTPIIAIAQDAPKPPTVIPAANELELTTKGAKKEQIRQSMIGFTSTRIFYTLATQKAVIVLNIDNTSTAFPSSGTVVIFDPEATEENIAKWINNQHSDGLYVDPAEPISTTKLPEGICTVTEHEKLPGEQKNHSDQAPYNDYKVKVAVKAHHEPGKFKLTAFEDEASVLVKVKAL